MLVDRAKVRTGQYHMLMYYGQQLEKCQAMEEVNGADSDEVGGNIEIWASCGKDHLPNNVHFSG